MTKNNNWQAYPRAGAAAAFGANPKPMARFESWSRQGERLLINQAAKELLGSDRVGLFLHRGSRQLRIAPQEGPQSLKISRWSKFTHTISARGFVAWAQVNWPTGATAELIPVNGTLVCTLPALGQPAPGGSRPKP